MNAYAQRRFNLKNLDCAGCAAKIESGLNQLDFVEEAIVDFAGLKLHVTTNDLEQVFKAVRKISPEVELESADQPEIGGNLNQNGQGSALSFHFKREAAFLIAAGTMLGLHLFYADWFHQKSYALIEIIFVLTAYLLAGWNVLVGAFKTIRRGDFFDENGLMVIATSGALLIHAYSEAIGVMVFYKIGELLQEKAVARSRRSIKSLLEVKPDVALRKTATGFETVPPETVKVGEQLIVRPGDKVPLDAVVIFGKSFLDSSALTGESQPVKAVPGDKVLAGQLNTTGALTLEVIRPFEASSIAKVFELVENATARKANTEKFITTFARYYTPALVLIAALIAVLPPLFINGATYKIWTYRALVLLVISCPCALVVSIPLGYFGGIGKASRRGILVKGSNFIDVLAKVKTIVFDKTGTLTRGVFEVLEVKNYNGYSQETLLEFAAAAEQHSSHPIAQSIRAEFGRLNRKLDMSKIGEHIDFSGSGVQTMYGGRVVMVGNDKLLHSKGIEHQQCSFNNTIAHVVVDGRYAGYVLIGDEIHPDAKKTIDGLRQKGISHIAMLTGDNRCIAEAVSTQLGLDAFSSDLFPEDKVSVFEKICDEKGQGYPTAFIGDGVNDAPVIARSDVGIAMGAIGADAAIDMADIVLLDDSPYKLVEAVSIARHTRRIVWQNIILAFVIKGIFIVLGALGLANMWEAVFADMGTALLAVANSTRSYRMANLFNIFVGK